MNSKEYSKWICNPQNEFNCSECPHEGEGNGSCSLPCGQQNCWVTCHIKEDVYA